MKTFALAACLAALSVAAQAQAPNSEFGSDGGPSISGANTQPIFTSEPVAPDAASGGNDAVSYPNAVPVEGRDLQALLSVTQVFYRAAISTSAAPSPGNYMTFPDKWACDLAKSACWYLGKWRLGDR